MTTNRDREARLSPDTGGRVITVDEMYAVRSDAIEHARASIGRYGASPFARRLVIGR